jgi:hypothetical protein
MKSGSGDCTVNIQVGNSPRCQEFSIVFYPLSRSYLETGLSLCYTSLILMTTHTHTHIHEREREREREREGGRERPGHTLPHPNCTRQLFSEVSILFLVASSVFGQPTTWVGIILYILYEFPLVENGEFSHDITLFTWLWVKIVRINIKKLIMTGFSPNYLLKILVQIKYYLCVREYLYLVIEGNAK